MPSKLVPIMMSSSNNHLDTTNIVAPHLWTAKSFLKDGPDTRATYATTSSLKRPHKPTNTSIRKGKKKKTILFPIINPERHVEENLLLPSAKANTNITYAMALKAAPP